jgi:hypothetical protein
MGLVAFLLLMSAEVGLGAVLGRSLVDQVSRVRIAGWSDRSRWSGDFCHLPRRSGLAVRQAVRPAKYRRSLDGQFLVSQTGNKLPGNKEKGRKRSQD